MGLRIFEAHIISERKVTQKTFIQCTFLINGLILESFENFLMQNFWPRIRIQHPKIGLLASLDIPIVCVVDFMAIVNVTIY